MANDILETFPPPLTLMPSEMVYTYPYRPLRVIPSPPVTQAKVNPVTLFTQALPGQSFEE